MFTDEQKKAYKAEKENQRKEDYKALKAVDVSNVKIGKPYYVGKKAYMTGENAAHLTLVCLEKGYRKNVWLTFKQVSEYGYRVKRGEKSVDLSYQKKNGQYVKWQLFNIEQTTGDYDIKSEDYTELFKKDYAEYIKKNDERYGLSSSFSFNAPKINECGNLYLCVESRSYGEPLPDGATEYDRFESKVKLDDGFYAYGIMAFDHVLSIDEIDDYHCIPYEDYYNKSELSSVALFEKYGKACKLGKKESFPQCQTKRIGEKGKKQTYQIWGNIADFALDIMHKYLTQKGINWTYNKQADVTTVWTLKEAM